MGDAIELYLLEELGDCDIGATHLHGCIDGIPSTGSYYRILILPNGVSIRRLKITTREMLYPLWNEVKVEVEVMTRTAMVFALTVRLPEPLATGCFYNMPPSC